MLGVKQKVICKENTKSILQTLKKNLLKVNYFVFKNKWQQEASFTFVPLGNSYPPSLRHSCKLWEPARTNLDSLSTVCFVGLFEDARTNCAVRWTGLSIPGCIRNMSVQLAGSKTCSLWYFLHTHMNSSWKRKTEFCLMYITLSILLHVCAHWL